MISIIKSFVARLSFISVLNVILVAYARPENTFLSDPSGPLLLLDDPLNDANSDNNHLLWDSDEIAFNIPDLADIATTSGNTDTFIDTSNGLFTTNSLDPLILASACDTQGSLSDDFLQARDEGSCAGRDKPAEAVNLPKLFDEDFLLQGLGAQLIRPSEEPNQGSGSEKSDAGWAAFGEAIPVDLQLQEDLQLCPGDLFLTSTTPVCENPVTGGVVYEFGQLHATLLNVIPCRCIILRVFFLSSSFFRIL